MSFILKSAAVAVAAASVGSAAVAGPYVNIESNSGYKGSDYGGTVTDMHVGFEGPVGESASYYIQAGPALVSEDGGENTTEFSGKVGASASIAERTSIYGELSFLTDGDEDNNYGTKLGVKYSF